MRHAWRTMITMAAALCIAAGGIAVAQGADEGTVWDSSFTQAQADRGEVAFTGTAGCAACHGFSGPLDGNRDMFPPLAGEVYLRSMTARPVAYLHDYIRDNKPAATPGSLRPETVLQLTAYILDRNGFPAGDSPLTAGRAASVLMVPPDWSGALPASALVRVVGCLAEGEGGDWVVERAVAPARVDDAAIDPGAAVLPLGDGAFGLRFVLTPLDDLVGQRVWVRGTLVGEGGVDGISVSQVESVAERCE